MTLATALIALGVSFGSILILAAIAFTAPLGWQDENGFHFGEMPFAAVNGERDAAANIGGVPPLSTESLISIHIGGNTPSEAQDHVC